ncbi:MAG: hypothetical protein ACSW8C_02860 [bacterium]
MDLEAFLEGQGDRAEVTYEEIGETRFSVKVVLKDESDKETWKTSLKDVYFYESYTESESQSEMPAVSPEVAEALPEESQSLISEGKSVEEAMPPESPSSDTEDEDNPWEVCMAKEPSLEERHACFEKYSQAATDKERAWVDGLDVKELRFVTFDSIVNGLDDEGQKALALYLIQKENEAELFAMIDAWVDARKVDNKHTLHIYGPDAKKEIGRCTYKLNPEVIKCFRDKLKSILKAMSHYQSARETLVLSLVLLKDLKFIINIEPVYDDSTVVVEFCPSQYENVNIQMLYHELNHALHDQLGIEALNFLMVGDFNSRLEHDLFRFLDKKYTDTELIKIPSLFFNLWLGGSWEPSMPDFVEVSQLKYFRKLQMFLLWGDLEEIWNIIGFTNIGGVIYVNRISDVNLLQKPRMFHGEGQKFTDPEFLGLNNGSGVDLSAYPFVKAFLEKMEETVTNHISDLCPTSEAWKIWLQLQGRRDTDVDYFTAIHEGTIRDLIVKMKEIKLIEDK